LIGHCAAQDTVEQLLVDLERFLHVCIDLLQLAVFRF
jgi:hypothetical protein